MERVLSQARALAHESRVQILHLLQQSGGGLGVQAIADHVGLHRTTARDHLEHLVAAGYVARTAEVLGTRGRPRILYAALERPAVPVASAWFHDTLVSILLAGYGRPAESRAAAAVRGGQERAERWAAEHGTNVPAVPVAGVGAFSGPEELAQLAVVEAHLSELGFEPEIDPVEPQIHLRHCPFLGLAQESTEVVCSVHLGLARGVLALRGGPLTAERLEPFVGPHHCVLHLGRTTASAL